MKAIILTYDKNRPLTEHMILSYEKTWPNHPFRFRIPYQKHKGTENERTEYIKTPKDIKNTVLHLLMDLPDEEWIYWSIDDKYPIELHVEELNKIHALISDGKIDEIDSIQICHRKSPLPEKNNETFTDEMGNIYFQKKNYNQFWIHSFTKVKVIRSVFERFPDVIPNAKSMDDLIAKLPIPSDQKLYVIHKSLGYFGESGTKGYLTRNCYESMKKYNFSTEQYKVRRNLYYYIGKPSKFIFSYHNIRFKLISLLKSWR